MFSYLNPRREDLFASSFAKQVALIEKSPRLDGVSLHTGTIPSKSLRETVMHFSLLRQQTHGIEINFKESPLLNKKWIYEIFFNGHTISNTTLAAKSWTISVHNS